MVDWLGFLFALSMVILAIAWFVKQWRGQRWN